MKERPAEDFDIEHFSDETAAHVSMDVGLGVGPYIGRYFQPKSSDFELLCAITQVVPYKGQTASDFKLKYCLARIFELAMTQVVPGTNGLKCQLKFFLLA